MDTTLLLDARLAALCGMLFTTVVALTAEEPETVPAAFQRLWLRYRIYQEARRMRSNEGATERFWEIDMTKLEP